GARDNFDGTVGASFQVGSVPAIVTHLGYYSTNGTLVNGHHVGIFPASGGNTPIASVTVSGAATIYTNSYLWVALDTPVTLSANTTYILAAEVFSGSGDPWPDVFIPTSWNPYYVGTNGPTTRVPRFGGGFWP